MRSAEPRPLKTSPLRSGSEGAGPQWASQWASPWTAAAGLLFLALHAGLTFLLSPADAGAVRAWSVNALRYGPLWAAVAAYGIAALLVVAISVDRPGRASSDGPSAARAGRQSGASRPWIGVFVVLATVGLFALLRSRYAFLGDNLLRVRETLQGTGSPAEYGIMRLLGALVRLAGARTLQEGWRVFVAVSLFSGAIYVAAAWWWTRAQGFRGMSRWGGYLALVSCGTVGLYCGYVEVYPFLTAVLFLGTLLACSAAEENAPLLPSLALLVLAVFLHRVALLWAPALLSPVILRRFVPVSGRGDNEARIPNARRALAIVGALVAAGILIAIVLAGRSTYLLPLFPSAKRPYALLSIAHVSDYLNAQFLGSAFGFLLAPLAVFHLASRRRIAPTTVVLLLAWLCPAAALFFFRPILGGADWDLLSLAAPFAVLFALSVYAGDGARSSDSAPFPAPALRLAVLLSVFNTLPWLWVQATPASIARARDLINTDRADYYVTHPPPLHLAFMFAANGLPELQREQLARGEREYPQDPRFSYNLAVLARGRGDWTEAEAKAKAAYLLAPSYLPALDVLYDAYKARRETTDQALVGRTILEAHRTRKDEVERYLTAARLEQIRREVEQLPEP